MTYPEWQRQGKCAIQLTTTPYANPVPRHADTDNLHVPHCQQSLLMIINDLTLCRLHMPAASNLSDGRLALLLTIQTHKSQGILLTKAAARPSGQAHHGLAHLKLDAA